ncbi:MAG: hypothetical protein C0494_15960 [Sphingobium sp.]|nr:hypothetical protein [Sphingobium sp.]
MVFQKGNPLSRRRITLFFRQGLGADGSLGQGSMTMPMSKPSNNLSAKASRHGKPLGKLLPAQRCREAGLWKRNNDAFMGNIRSYIIFQPD